MKAIITVLGEDRVGIIAKVSSLLADEGINILDISQTIMQDVFTMIMLVDISGSTSKISDISEKLDACGKELGVSITIKHEDLFKSMHRI
ncbi:MAG: ACT domain-containing protein [Clostridia bacterium]|nr:ACT domain-containing protein [Clostridia bacterium]